MRAATRWNNSLLFGFYHFEVGSDYPVVSVDGKTLKVHVTDKKGRESTERLNVESVEEVRIKLCGFTSEMGGPKGCPFLQNICRTDVGFLAF